MALQPAPLITEISDVYPNPSNGVARTGFAKLWNFVTSLLGTTGGIAAMLTASKLIDPAAIYNLSIVFSVNANVLTATLKSADGVTALAADNAAIVSMRNVTLATGSILQRAITAPVSVNISSGSTAGHASGTLESLYWYLIDNAGTLELAWSTKNFGAGGIVTTVAEGGVGAADSATVMYSSTLRSNVPFRCVWRSKDSQTVAGLWAAVPTVVEMAPFAGRVGNLPAGFGPVSYSGAVIPEGWLACDGTAVSRTTYAELWAALGTTTSPWGQGDGSTTFNVPDFRDRVPVGEGTGTVVETIASQTAAANAVVVVSNLAKWVTGQVVVVSGASGFVGLVNGSFWIVRVDATHISIANSLANALAGTVVTVTGTGVATLTVTLATRVIGQQGGEDAHSQALPEVTPHTHPYNVNTSNANGNPGGATTWFWNQAGSTTSSTGSGTAANIMQAFGVTKMIISTGL